jgi:hypothetical protein
MALSDQVQLAIERYLSTKFTATTVTEVFDGGSKDLFTAFTPISSITSITNTATSSVKATTTYSFYPDQGAIYLKDGSTWNDSIRRKWSVVYIYGASAIPDDIQLAIDTWVALLTADDTGTLSSYKTGDDSETYFQIGEMPGQVKGILDNYKGRRSLF